MGRFLLGILLVGTVNVSQAVGSVSQPRPAEPLPYGHEPGYIEDVNEEMLSEPQEMFLVEKPAILSGPTLHQKIFNNELSTEFTWRYRQEFGRTEQEENYFLVNRQGYYMTPNSLTATQEDFKRRQFAEYMVKRLAEFHTENILKNDPQFKRVYEAKQAISNVSMKVGTQTKFDLNYSFVGNFAQGTLTNPISPLYVTLRMDPGQLTPTEPKEIDLSTRKQLPWSLLGEVGYLFYQKALRFILTKALTPNMSVNIYESIYMADAGIDYTREGLTIVGLNVTF